MSNTIGTNRSREISGAVQPVRDDGVTVYHLPPVEGAA